MRRYGFMIYLMLASILVLCIASCTKSNSELRIGIIGPSIDHLPLTYLIKTQGTDPQYRLVSFNSGWELQEALVAGKVDTGIMPFTYAWNAVARGNNLKIASFFERETDGIVAGSSIQDITELETKKVGMLKASTLEILFEDATHSRGIQCSKVYFRSPNEMVSALQAGQIDAMVGYVPLIQKMSDKYKVIHWFSSDYSAHPCCDIVLNQDQMSKGKQALHDKLLADLKLVIEEVAIPSESVVSFAMKQYGLNRDQVFDSLKHTVFRMGLDDAGKAFERKMTDISVGLGYQPNQIRDSDIYLER